MRKGTGNFRKYLREEGQDIVSVKAKLSFNRLWRPMR
jgi:hypothetical protein